MANAARVSVGRSEMRQALTELILRYKRINRFGRLLRTTITSRQASTTGRKRSRSASPDNPSKPRLDRVFRNTQRLCLPLWYLDSCVFRMLPRTSARLFGKLTRCSERRRFPHLYREARVVDHLELDQYVERRNAEAKAAAENAPRKPNELTRVPEFHNGSVSFRGRRTQSVAHSSVVA